MNDSGDKWLSAKDRIDRIEQRIRRNTDTKIPDFPAYTRAYAHFRGRFLDFVRAMEDADNRDPDNCLGLGKKAMAALADFIQTFERS